MSHSKYSQKRSATNRSKTQTGGNKFSSETIDKLSNLNFVVKNRVLGDDSIAVIHKLIKRFNKLDCNKECGDLELTEFFDAGVKDNQGRVICDRCAIVLKYFDHVVCINQGRTVIVDPAKGTKNADCKVHKGVVRLFLKQIKGNTAKYVPITTVNVKVDSDLQQYGGNVYVNIDAARRLEDDTHMAVTRAQSDVIRSLARGGQLPSSTPEEIISSVQTIENINYDTLHPTIEGQIANLNKTVSMVPSNSSIESANAVAKYLRSNPHMTTVMIPDTNSINITDQASEGLSCILTEDDVLTDHSHNITDFSKEHGNASLPIDATVTQVPNDAVQKMQQWLQTVAMKTGQTTDAIINKIGSFFKGGSNNGRSVVSVSDSLHVYTDLHPQDANEAIQATRHTDLRSDRSHESNRETVSSATHLSNARRLKERTNRLNRIKPDSSSNSARTSNQSHITDSNSNDAYHVNHHQDQHTNQHHGQYTNQHTNQHQGQHMNQHMNQYQGQHMNQNHTQQIQQHRPYQVHAQVQAHQIYPHQPHPQQLYAHPQMGGQHSDRNGYSEYSDYSDNHDNRSRRSSNSVNSQSDNRRSNRARLHNQSRSKNYDHDLNSSNNRSRSAAYDQSKGRKQNEQRGGYSDNRSSNTRHRNHDDIRLSEISEYSEDRRLY